MENEIKRGRKKKEIDGNFAKLLSELLQKVKTENGIIQDDVAKSIGVSRQALGKWANGETVPDILDLKKLAKYFNVSADYLLGLTNNKTTDTDLQAVCEYTGLSEETIENIRNCCVIPKELAPEYYKANKYIINNILSNDNFWNIVFHLVFLMHFSNELQTEYPDINQIVMQCIDNGVLENQQLKEYYNTCNSADVCRYSIMREIEKISDLFDSRVEKEGSDNGKHNTTKE